MLCPPFHSEEAPFFYSKRAFQTQFRRWNFPAKQRPAHKNDRLVARIKELWEKNLAQREMLRVLNEEDGYDIKPRELMRVRTKNRWLLRVPNAAADARPDLPGGRDDDNDDGTDDDNDDGRGRKGGQDLQATTASGNNRFPSEMTIDGARDILSLETATYRTLRTNFQQICQEDSLLRKTEAGPERWAAAKQRLVGSSPALQRMLWTSNTMAAGADGGTHNFDQRVLALDVICTDVTKRLRTLETRMTLGEAKSVLGVNPTESRDMRAALHAVLSEARFVSKSDATPQQWEELKQQWGQRAPLVRAILLDASGTEETKVKLRALETVASDVMKRLRDQRRSRQTLAGGSGSSHRQEMQQLSATAQSSPNMTHEQMELAESLAGSNFDDMSEVSQMAFGSPGSDALHMPLTLSQASSLTGDSSQQAGRGALNTMSAAMQLGASGLGSTLLLGPGGQAAEAAFMGHHQQPYYNQGAVATSSANLASTSSQMYRQPSTPEQSRGAAGPGGELPLQIEQEQELAAYLAHMQGASPTFNVQLVWKGT
ncbi:hypothetical protein LLEC1_07897 [Akanthomyces lecanii]|uniref:Clr5 domain-containing protein n=1 Tax=Cordyceps confragosa TaxID=2714763 RepID=A0A179I4Z5_CORDF|nr:hypothetical protein LLEC1_07897 [Akanthomyces lecanii]